VKWDKTSHVFPSEAELARFHKKLGELLIERNLISEGDLAEALSWQQKINRPLGTLLVRMGALDEADLTSVLSAQLRLPIEKLDPRGTPSEVLKALPRRVALAYSAFPVRILEDGRLLIAVADRVKPQHRVDIETALQRKVALCLTTRSELGFALRLHYGQQESPLDQPGTAYRRLGDILLDEEMIPPAVLDAAIEKYAPGEPQFLGEYLVREDLITPEQLDLALKLQSTCQGEAGDVEETSIALSRGDRSNG
jgi:hypothetical protein